MNELFKKADIISDKLLLFTRIFIQDLKYSKLNKYNYLKKLSRRIGLISFLVLFSNSFVVFAQTYGQPYSTTYPQQTSTMYAQTAAKQEIARLEINVVRGDRKLPITQVPRVQKGDVLKVRLLDEPVSGIKLDQTQWDWTLVVAYANPLINKSKEEIAAREVRFRQTGWYKEYTFTVPFDSQPVFFLSPRANFRGQVMKAMNKNFGELQKIGEKMVEISGAYAQISTFLNELQMVINQNQYGYNSSYNSYLNQYPGSAQYPGQYNYNNQYSGQYGYGSQSYYGNQSGNYIQNPHWLDQAVERLAKSFNIQMPDCWRMANFNSNSNYNSYNTYNNSGSYGGTYGNYTGGGGNYSGNGSGSFNTSDFVARSQCVAKTVRLEDFDISITRMWQQGGVFLAAELQKKYPQLAYYINMAAAAIDFIVKVFQKSPLRIVPTMITSVDNINAYQANSATQQNTYAAATTAAYGYQPTTPVSAGTSGNNIPPTSKISVFSNQQPNDQGFLTAYPIVVQKWQPNADTETVSVYPPMLAESCLHAGLNILKNTHLSDDWTSDSYARDFKLVVISNNGFRKEFPLKKNIGLSGWELNISPQEMAVFPKVSMNLEGYIIGFRGFNEVNSPKFNVPLAGSGKWEITPEAQKAFAVGGKRRIFLRNLAGDCRCIQSVIFKPAFGGQFEFVAGARENALQISPDGRDAWFEVDSTNFQPGAGTLEVRNYGGEAANLNIKLYPQEPKLMAVRAARGDREILISGERLEQVRYVTIGGYRATVQSNTFPPDALSPQVITKLAVFDDPQARVTSNSVVLELGLEDDRKYIYPQNFSVGPARPEIKSNEIREIEGISNAALLVEKTANSSALPSINAQLNARKFPVFPIDTSKITANIQNILSDYEFKNENIQIETRIEKSQSEAGNYLKTDFEVLDWRTMRLEFFLYGDIHTHLGGRRIQFRIKDRERGDSDWYTIKQTFVRVPQIAQITCTDQMQGFCQMKGDGMDYIAQVSVDGGKTWYPGENSQLQALPTVDGLSEILIPQLLNKKLLQIKLRDYSPAAGLAVNNYNYINTAKINFTAKQKLKSVKSAGEQEVVKNNNSQTNFPDESQKREAAPLPTTSVPVIPALPDKNLKINQNAVSPAASPNQKTLPPPDPNSLGIDEVIDMRGKPNP